MRRSGPDEGIMMEAGRRKDPVVAIRIDQIVSNPYQPRQIFSQEKISELTQSIRTYGLLQPVIVCRKGKKYQLVAGERRLLACRELGWQTITAVVKQVSDSAVAAMALIENLQREDLNFIEEARGYARLMQEFGFTQEALAQRIGKSQSSIANKIRLLKLSSRVQLQLVEGNLTERHARALLKLSAEEEQMRMVEEIITGRLSVQQAEERIDRISGRNKGRKKDPRKYNRVVIRDLRIFMNTLRQAVAIIEKSGLSPEVAEKEGPDYYEITIRLPKGR